MVKVLFVCLGNICRSPLAEGIFNQHVFSRGLQDYMSADSAGTSGWHIGELPDNRSIQIAREHGIHLTHRGRKLTPDDLKHFDYIIAMDGENLHDIHFLRNSYDHGRASVSKMLDFDNKATGGDVPDPYYGGQDGFKKVYNLLDESISNLIDHIVSVHRLDNEQ
jgi:protein-tyrosine phosphatase